MLLEVCCGSVEEAVAAAGLTGVGAVAATIGILRATSPAAQARRPHHWR